MPTPDERQHTLILTLQAARPGGVPTVIDWWYRFLTGWGNRATVLYAHFDEEPISFPQRVIRTLRHWRVHERPEHPNPTLANPAPPVPLWLIYLVPQWLFGPLLSRFDHIVFAGGPVHAAISAALRGRPYILWMGTLYEDELRGKIAVGDAWANSILSSPFWRFLAWQESFVLKRAARILPQSPFTMRRITESFPELSERLDLVMVPVDTERFTPPSSVHHPDNERYLLNVSRINDPRKNIRLLLEAFKRVINHYPDLRLVLAGDDPEPELLTFCDQLEIRDRIVFEGKTSADRLTALYQGADLMLISSAQEGLGIVMLEALSCGTPVIATDCGGPEGIVIDGVTGRIVPNHNAEKFTQAILDVLSNPEVLQAMRQRARDFACTHWSEDEVERKLHQHFDEVFPVSEPASRQPQQGKWREVLALIWSLIVLVAYIQHQVSLHWPAIQSQLLDPLLHRLP